MISDLVRNKGTTMQPQDSSPDRNQRTISRAEVEGIEIPDDQNVIAV